MGFNNIGGAIKLNNITTYNNVGSKNNVFKTQFYDDIDKIDYTIPYTQTTYNEVTITQVEGDPTFEETMTMIGCSTLNTVIGFAEGFTSFAEAVVDTGVILVGVAGTLLTGATDIFINGMIFGDWDFDATKSMWKDVIMPAVATNYTDMAFSALYETGPMKEVEENAHSAFKREGGIVYEISEGVGYYTGMIALSTVTAGAASSISTTTRVSQVVTKVGAKAVTKVGAKAISQGISGAVGSFGKNAQSNYHTTIDNKVKEHYISELMKSNNSLTYEDAEKIVEENILNGVYADYDTVRKAKEDGLTFGEITTSNAKALGTAAIDGGIYMAAGSNPIAKSNSKIIEKGGAIAIKASKAYISEGYNSIVNDEEFNFMEASIEAGSIIIAEFSSLGFKTLTNKLSSYIKPGITKVTENVSNKVKPGLAKMSEKLPTTSNSLFKNIKINILAKDSTSAMDKFSGASKASENTTSKIIKNVRATFGEIKDVAKESGKKGKDKAIKSITSTVYDAGMKPVTDSIAA